MWWGVDLYVLSCWLACFVHGKHVICLTNRHKRGKSRPTHVVQATLVGRQAFCFVASRNSSSFSLSLHKYLSPPFSLLLHSPLPILNPYPFPPYLSITFDSIPTTTQYSSHYFRRSGPFVVIDSIHPIPTNIQLFASTRLESF